MPTTSRRVKIVCTLGPSSQSRQIISKLIQEGMDVARLNFSHGDHDTHRQYVTILREESKRLGRFVAIMQDLQGPKLRVGKIGAAGIMLESGDALTLMPEGMDCGSPKGRIIIPLSREIATAVIKDLKPGARILFDDGKIVAHVSKISGSVVQAEVSVGGKLTDHKGLNLPGTPLSIPSCTDKDWEDLKLGLALGVDAVALSFVRSAKDIEDLALQIGKQSNVRPHLVAKIEREEAVENRHRIIEVADGILIARGDMAVELGAGRVPIIQKDLIHACAELGVPIITATQMLESMVSSPSPTRAEANDVANAVFDGTDAVMLSAETASGRYPIEAVKVMSDIILEAEQQVERYSIRPIVQPMPGSIVDSIEYSAAKVAEHVGAVAIAVLTHSGVAARTVAKYRPDTPIIAIMDSEQSLRKLGFVWGVRGVLIPEIVATDNLFGMVEQVLGQGNWASHGDLVVVTAGVPTLRRGTTNMIKVHKIGASIEKAPRRAKIRSE